MKGFDSSESFDVSMEKTERKPNRLKDYDYSQNGAYFITICTKDKKPVLSEITPTNQPNIKLKKCGMVVLSEIEKLNSVYNEVSVDVFVIMPNHIHLIIRIENYDGQSENTPTISRIVKQFKMSIAKQIGQSIWQKGFYDHIIRDENDYMTKYQYIENNPAKWAEDKYYHG